VAAYAIINYAGIGKKDNTKKIRKEATVKAWQSVSDYINYADQKFKTISCFSCDEQEMKKEMLRELDNYSAKLENIKGNKDVDDKMLSIVDIIKQRFTDFKTPMAVFYDSVTIIKSRSQDLQLSLLPVLQQNLDAGLTRIVNRDSSEFKNFLSDVNKTYKLNLEQITPKDVYDPSAITRKWNIGCITDIDLQKDGRFTWKGNGADFTGTWEFKDSVLTFYSANETLKYKVQQLTPRFMLMDYEINGTIITLGACSKQ
jgi:molecular chaperone GrpE (heat shock protein)